MILVIDTSQKDKVRLRLYRGRAVLKEKSFFSERAQAEKLLPEIEKLLRAEKIGLDEITEIKVVQCGESFTSLRIGVLTANALAYALGISIAPTKGGRIKRAGGINIVEPKYNRKPNITNKHLTFDI